MNKIISYIILIVIFFFLGLGGGYLVFNKTCAEIDKDNTYEAGWEAAKARLINMGLIRPIEKDQEIIEINGTVENVGDKKIRVKIIPLEPLADPALDLRDVEINENTIILQTKEKEASVYNKEITEYSKELESTPFDINSSGYPLPPNRFMEEEISISNIAVGDTIKIEANEDIKEAKEFRANRIIIQKNN